MINADILSDIQTDRDKEKEAAEMMQNKVTKKFKTMEIISN